jgi:hypothetical protein
MVDDIPVQQPEQKLYSGRTQPTFETASPGAQLKVADLANNSTFMQDHTQLMLNAAISAFGTKKARSTKATMPGGAVVTERPSTGSFGSLRLPAPQPQYMAPVPSTMNSLGSSTSTSAEAPQLVLPGIGVTQILPNSSAVNYTPARPAVLSQPLDIRAIPATITKPVSDFEMPDASDAISNIDTQLPVPNVPMVPALLADPLQLRKILAAALKPSDDAEMPDAQAEDTCNATVLPPTTGNVVNTITSQQEFTTQDPPASLHTLASLSSTAARAEVPESTPSLANSLPNVSVSGSMFAPSATLQPFGAHDSIATPAQLLLALPRQQTHSSCQTSPQLSLIHRVLLCSVALPPVKHLLQFQRRLHGTFQRA